MSYDSRPETEEHIQIVQRYLGQLSRELLDRARCHDASKLMEPEKAIFDEFTPKLRELTYDSEEYRADLAEMREKGLGHHYEVNDHHPEHHERGVYDMDLVQLLEMLADWKAATERHDDGDLGLSITKNAERFGYDLYFAALLRNTADSLGWLDGREAD